jgi:hypothetical protein
MQTQKLQHAFAMLHRETEKLQAKADDNTRFNATIAELNDQKQGLLREIYDADVSRWSPLCTTLYGNRFWCAGAT